METTDRETLRRFIEQVDPNAKVDALPDYVHDDIVLPADTLPNGRQGIEGLREHLEYLPTVIEYTSTVRQMVAEGDKVAAHIVIRGKQIGDFMGIPASGQEWAIEEMLIAQFRDGKISQVWRVADLLSLMQQLGAASSEAVGAES
jgi:predicted ester cyclase